jgi:hypothetical protein
MNTKSLAICLGGYYNYIEKNKVIKCRDGNPTEAQLKSLTWLIDYLVKLLKLSTKDVYTHNELQPPGKPSCPGIAGTEIVKKYRETK